MLAREYLVSSYVVVAVVERDMRGSFCVPVSKREGRDGWESVTDVRTAAVAITASTRHLTALAGLRAFYSDTYEGT